MNRLFHAKITTGQYAVLVFLFICVACLLWQVDNGTKPVVGILLSIVIFLMVVVVERMINTTYTITTDGMLVIHKGRFARDVIVDIHDIVKVENVCSFSFSGIKIGERVRLTTDKQVILFVNPDNVGDFIGKINKTKETRIYED